MTTPIPSAALLGSKRLLLVKSTASAIEAELLKATASKTIVVPAYTRKDGTLVPAHTKVVHYDPTKDVGDVLSGKGSHSQKQAHKKLSKLGHWESLEDSHKLAHILSSATNIQQKASASAAVSGWKASMLAGKKPTASQQAAFDALPEAKKAALQAEVGKPAAAPAQAAAPAPAAGPLHVFHGVGGFQAEVHAGDGGTFNVTVKDTDAGEYLSAVKKFPNKADAIAHAQKIAGHAAGPKEGDTKPAADGGTLVLKDGHWVKQGGDAPAAKGDVFVLDSQYEKMNAGKWVVYNVSPDGEQVYMHKVGAKVPNGKNSATIPASTLQAAIAKGTAKKEAPAGATISGYKVTEGVNAVPMVHATTGDDVVASIKQSGFNLSNNSMYGKGVYFSDKDLSQSGGKYKTSLQVKLKPHKQLVLDSGLEVATALQKITGLSSGHLGSDKAREAFLSAGIGSLRFPVDGETYTVVLDPALIELPKPKLGQGGQGLKEAVKEKPAPAAEPFKPTLDQVMALHGKPAEEVKATMKEWGEKMGGADKLGALLMDYKQQAAEKEKPKAATESAKPATPKPAEPAPSFNVGDTVPAKQLRTLKPGSVVQLFHDGKPWRKALIGHNAVWFSKQNGDQGWQKNSLKPQHVTSFKMGQYGDGQLLSEGSADWMPDAQKTMAVQVLANKQAKHSDAKAYRMGGTLVVGEIGKPFSFVWVDEDGKWGAGFHASQEKKLASGEGLSPVKLGGSDSGPKEGDTKQGADGATLVLKDGHWVKQGGEAPKAKQPASIAMPAFEEGKEKAGVKAHYEKVGQKVLDLASAGDAAGLEKLKADGLKPNSKGKVGNTWKGKTQNSKLLLALHDQALAHTKDNTAADQPAQAVSAEPVPAPAAPAAEASPNAASKLTQIPWDAQLLPVANSNAKSHNGQVAKIKAMAEAGDVAGLQAYVDAKAGAKQTYAKKQHLLAATALAALKEDGAPAAPEANPLAGVSAAEAIAKNPHMPQLKLKELWIDANADKVGAQAEWAMAVNPAPAKPAGLAESQKKMIDDIATWPDAKYHLADIVSGGNPVAAAYAQQLLDAKKATVAVDKPKPPTGIEEHSEAGAYLADAAYGLEHNDLPTLQDVITALQGDMPAPGSDANKVLQFAKDAYKHVAGAAPATSKPADPTAADQGPKEGDVKQGADGMLVFTDGRWHKLSEKAKAAIDSLSLDDLKEFADTPGMPVSQNAYIKAKLAGAEPMDSWQQTGGEDSDAWAFTEKDPGFSGVNTLIAEIDGQPVYVAYEPDSATFEAGVMDLEGGEPDSDHFTHPKEVLDYLAKKFGASLEMPSLGQVEKLAGKVSGETYSPKVPKPAKAAAASAGSIEQMDGWTKVGGQEGYNEGGYFTDASGQKWYCKFSSGGEEVARSEALALKLYALAGCDVPDVKLVSMGGKVGTASKVIDGLQQNKASLKAGSAHGIFSGFAADAWLANWDTVGNNPAAGKGFDNIQFTPDGKAWRIDAGGALAYKGTGAKKSASEWGDKVIELKTLRDAAINPNTAAAFGKMTEADVTASVKKVVDIPDVAIRALVNQFGHGSAAQKEALADKLIARKASMLAQYPNAAKKPKPKAGDASWVKLKPGEKIVETGEKFGVEYAKIEIPAAGFNLAGIPKPYEYNKSSSPHVNAANTADIKSIYDLAATGASGDQIKSMTFEQIVKATGEKTGKKLTINEHPSKLYVQEYLNQVAAELDAQLKPTYRMEHNGDLKGGYDTAAAEIAGLVGTLDYDQFGSWGKKAADYLVLDQSAGEGIPKPDSGLFKNIETHSPELKSFKSASDAKYATLSSAEQNACKAYTGSAYIAWNEAMRTGDVNSKAFADSKPMRDAFEKAAVELPSGIMLHRGINVGGDTYKSVVGAVIQDGSFQSCSFGSNAAFSGKISQLRLHVTKGVKAVMATTFSNFGGAEREIILHPNTRYVVMQVGKQGGQNVVDVLVLPHED